MLSPLRLVTAHMYIVVDLVTHIIFQSISQECRALVSCLPLRSSTTTVVVVMLDTAQSLKPNHCLLGISALPSRDHDRPEGRKLVRDSGQWPSDGHPHLGVSAALTPDTVDTKLATSLSVSLLALQLWSTLDEMNDLIILDIGHTRPTHVLKCRYGPERSDDLDYYSS